MTVSTTTSRVEYAGNGSTTAFSVPFYFLAAGDLKVYKAGTLQTLTTHYTVSGAGNEAGGTVTFLSAPTAGQDVVIFRDPALTQQTDYPDNDPFPAQSHERALDRLTMIAQRNRDLGERSIRLNDSDTSGASTELPTPVANKGLKWNSSGSGLENTTNDIDDMAAASAASAAAAASSATSASASASSASSSASSASSSASSASTSATNAANSATSASTSASSASTSATNAASSASSASTSASAASTSATNAASSASSASTSATNAASSASAAATSETNAATSAASAAASYDSFDDRYLGAKASDPTLDNDGNALLTGALYWNTTSTKMRVYSGTAWGDVSASTSFAVQTFSGTGSQTAFTLTSSPGSANALFVYISGVRQTPGTDYTLSGSTLTFTSAPASGTNNILTVGVSAHDIGVPSDGTVTTPKIADAAVTPAKLDRAYAELAAAQSFTKAQRGAVVALSDGATITPDFSLGNNFSVTLGGNRTLANPSNLTAGQHGVIVITQDGTGSRTLAFGSNWKFAAGAAPTLTTTASAVDVLAYYVESSSRITARLITDVK